MKSITPLLWVLFYGLAVFLSINRHVHSELYDYHSEISGDKAGYMVYLPAAFCYQFEARRFPAAMDKQIGSGFRLNLATNKVETKYPYGVALLQAPFWGVGHALSTDKSGFSKAVRKAIDVAGASYFVLGLWLLFATLRRHFSGPVVLVTLTLLTLGTNLWYYGIIETGMSHVYSFFAFALLLWLLGRARLSEWGRHPPYGEILAVGGALGLIAILRPLNLLFALPLLLWPTQAAARWQEQLRGVMHWRSLLLLVAVVAVCLLPQVAYYQYLHGNYIVYSYGQEGFPYWLSPRLAEVWFAPNNGAFLYNPIILLTLPGLWLLARRSVWQSILTSAIWLLASYLYASWWSYSLGCGYAGRGFVELYPLLAWPLAWLSHSMLANRRWALGTLCVLLVVYNLHMSVNFDRCFYGRHDWDWDAYVKLLKE